MTIPKRVFLIILATCAPVWALLCAQDRPLPRSTGRVLLLHNQGVLEGDIERHGDQFRVRRASGETWVAADRTMCLCADWEEAFSMLSGQANLHDPDERVRLSRWCEHNNLHAHALAEAAAAVKLRPEHAAAKQLLARLQKINPRNPGPAPVPAKDPVEATNPPVDLSAESLALFTNRVQPILMNACANCHATGRGGAFKLARCHDATLNRRGLQQNLAAVLAQIDLDEPPVSRLLYKAVSAHGDLQKAPLAGRQSVPYQTLEEWVETVITTNPHLRKQLGRPKKAAAEERPGPRSATGAGPQPSEETVSPVLSEARLVSQPRPALPVAAAPFQAPANPPAPTGPPLPVAPNTPSGAMPQTPAAPLIRQAPTPSTTQTAPQDEFDPWIFNTQPR